MCPVLNKTLVPQSAPLLPSPLPLSMQGLYSREVQERLTLMSFVTREVREWLVGEGREGEGGE